METTIEKVLKQVTEEWAPAALELGIQMTFWNGVSQLLLGGLFAVLTAALFYNTMKALKKSKNASYSDKEGYLIVAALLAIAGLIAAIPTIVMLFNIWNWIAVFNPKLALAHTIFERIMKLGS
jgi:hypothetical protein